MNCTHEVPEFEVNLPEGSSHISLNPWRHHPKEALIKYFFEWFITRFEKGETIESLTLHDFQMYRELRKTHSALRILDLVEEARTYLDPIERPLFSDFLDMQFHDGFRLGYLWGHMQGADAHTHAHAMRNWRSLLISSEMIAKHQHAKEAREALIAKYADFVRDKLLSGYRGSAANLVRFALKQPEFSALKAATETRTMTNAESLETGQIKKRPFISKRKLEELTRSILINAPEK